MTIGTCDKCCNYWPACGAATNVYAKPNKGDNPRMLILGCASHFQPHRNTVTERACENCASGQTVDEDLGRRCDKKRGVDCHLAGMAYWTPIKWPVACDECDYAGFGADHSKCSPECPNYTEPANPIVPEPSSERSCETCAEHIQNGFENCKIGKRLDCCVPGTWAYWKAIASAPEPVAKRHELDERVKRAEEYLSCDRIVRTFEYVNLIRDLLAVVGEQDKRQHQSDINYDALEKQSIAQGEKIRHQREELSKWNSERVAIKERDAARLECEMLRDLSAKAIKSREAAEARVKGLESEFAQRDEGKVVVKGWMNFRDKNELERLSTLDIYGWGTSIYFIKDRNDVTGNIYPVTLIVDKGGK